jgi:hypothetical protein
MILHGLAFLLVFGWKATASADLIMIFSGALAAWVFIINLRPIPSGAVTLVAWFALLSGYAAVIVVMHGALDSQIALRSLRAMVNLLGGVALVDMYFRRYGRARFVRQVGVGLALAMVGHAALILLMYVLPSFRESVYALASTRSYVNLVSPFELGYRIPGLTYGLAQTSVLMASGLLILPLALQGTDRWRQGVAWLVAGGAILVSVLLTGRSGLVILVLGLPVVLAVAHVVGHRRAGRRLALAAVTIAALAAVGAAVIMLARSILPEAFGSYTMVAAREVVQAVADPGESQTVQAMSSMYFLPREPLAFLFGDSGMGRGPLGYIPSDVGFVLSWHALGLVGTILMLVPILYALWLAYRAWSAAPLLAAVTVVVLLGNVLLHMKEVALFTRNQWSVHAILIATCLYIQRPVTLARFDGGGEWDVEQ